VLRYNIEYFDIQIRPTLFIVVTQNSRPTTLKFNNDSAFCVKCLFCERLRSSEGSVLAFSTPVRGFKPGRTRRILGAKKILSTPSFGGEVDLRHVKIPNGKITRHFSSIVPPFAPRISRVVEDVEASSGKSGNF
jgi:hypothetical protein